MIQKIISGGQTGADLAGLDAAIRHNIPHGGWIPKGRITENGPLSEAYNLTEMPGSSYPARTEKNVLDSDGTLIIAHGKLTDGSALTRDFAAQHNKPHLFVDLEQLSISESIKTIRVWLAQNTISILNIAGPRASKDPVIYNAVSTLLNTLLSKNS